MPVLQAFPEDVQKLVTSLLNFFSNEGAVISMTQFLKLNKPGTPANLHLAHQAMIQGVAGDISAANEDQTLGGSLRPVLAIVHASMAANMPSAFLGISRVLLALRTPQEAIDISTYNCESVTNGVFTEWDFAWKGALLPAEYLLDALEANG